MSLAAKLKKNSTIKETAVLSESKFYDAKDMIPTRVPMLNVALSGSLDGGLTPGFTMIAGPSKHFKTGFSLVLASAYLKKYDDAVILFYDSEFGTPQGYFEMNDINMDRVIHTPITDVEVLKHDIMSQLDNIERGDHVLIMIDSIGNLASKKEVEDAIEGKSVADMSRAKQLKSLFRMITPHLNLKDIPLLAVNHTYKEIGLYPKDIVGGGCVVIDTPILLSDGSSKAVQEIVVGDLVKTVNGPKGVSAVWNPDTLVEGEPECFEIEFEDGYKVICSDQHEFRINGYWIEAKDLVVGMDASVV